MKQLPSWTTWPLCPALAWSGVQLSHPEEGLRLWTYIGIYSLHINLAPTILLLPHSFSFILPVSACLPFSLRASVCPFVSVSLPSEVFIIFWWALSCDVVIYPGFCCTFTRELFRICSPRYFWKQTSLWTCWELVVWVYFIVFKKQSWEGADVLGPRRCNSSICLQDEAAGFSGLLTCERRHCPVSKRLWGQRAAVWALRELLC